MNVKSKRYMPILAFVVVIASFFGGCASRNYTYYLVEPEQQQNPEFSEDEKLQRPFTFGSTTTMKVRWNDGDLVTEIDVPMVSTGQRVVIEHATSETGLKKIPSTQLVAPPPTPADSALEKAYAARGLRINDDAPAVSIARSNERMKEAVKSGSYGLALEWAELVLARYPSHPQTLRAKASLLLLMGERKNAIEIYEKVEAIESDPDVRKKLEELQANEP
ncbi:MAG: hypothetical protein GY822_11455 [Deltaproteobacteria bacterium]|nr:hypothetical protein [Deltaproteobacteria bacterium]